jgi:hypothetical protein
VQTKERVSPFLWSFFCPLLESTAMADAPAPTYRVENVDGADRYVCIIPYAGLPDDICGHWAVDFELFSMHMEQRHNGDLVAQAVTPQVATTAPRAGQAAASPASTAAPKE